MNVDEFQSKYSILIDEFEEIAGKKAVWSGRITKLFIEHLQEKNIKISFKLPKTLIPKQYHDLPYISEFWLNFLQENTYFTKKRVTEDYILKYNFPEDKCVNIKKDFHTLIRYFLRYGIIEHYNVGTYKINKKLVEIYSESYQI